MTKPTKRTRPTLQRPEQVTLCSQESVISELTLPRYSNAGGEFATGNDIGNDYSDNVLKEIEKDCHGGDGGDSDVEGDEVLIHESAVVPSRGDNDDVEPEDSRGKSLGIVDLTDSSGGVTGKIIMNQGNVTSIQLEDDVQSEVKIASPPPDWKPPTAQESRGEPKFEELDNPGSWPQYCFRPVFNGRSSSTKYRHHALPTGAIPVPKNDEGGRREYNGWTFHYNGWTNPGPSHRQGATMGNMFPEGTEGCLDANVLKKLGLTKSRMQSTDALFFLQLILPICNTEFSGVKDDPRISYYHDVETHTNSTKFASGMGGSYGHNWTPTTSKELVTFDGVLVRDGVLGGTQGALHRRWDKLGPCYSPEIARMMTLTRFGELKRNIKLCNNDKAPKKGEGKSKSSSVLRFN